MNSSFKATLSGIFLILASLISNVSQAQDYLSMSLEELLGVRVTIASKNELTTRESPGIITVINRDQIVNSGARDLLGVLRLFAPGVQFGMDVEGVVGIGMRGLWAHEGKVLLMIDGQETNEEQFATTQFGNHFPAEIIERVEIIRGPGSAIYGGYAGVGVINVITRGEKLKGGFVSGQYARTENSTANQNIAFGIGDEADDIKFSLTGVVSDGARSDRNNIDTLGSALSMEDASALDSFMLNFALQYGDLSLRAILDQYHLSQIDLWGENYTAGGPLRQEFDTYLFNVKYDFKDVAGENLTLTPEWKLKIQEPWKISVPSEGYTNDKTSEKMQVGVTGLWDITDAHNLVFGVEGYTSKLSQPDNPSAFEEAFKDGSSELDYTNYAGYLQWMYRGDDFNTTLGGRYDDSDEYGDSFVPRAGITKTWEDFHAKAMYSESFRIPGGIIPNRIPIGFSSVTPEEARNYEIEFGYRLSEETILTVNAFDMEFDDVIVFQADPVTGIGSYFNSGELGSRGVEAELRTHGETVQGVLNYAFYESSNSTVDIYEVPQDNDSFLAFPQHRLNLALGVKASDKVSIHPSLSFFGKRYGVAYDPMAGGTSVQKFGSDTIANLNIRLDDLVSDGVDINFGVRNIFDRDFEFIQPYDGGHAPLPTQGRAFYATVEYGFDSLS